MEDGVRTVRAQLESDAAPARTLLRCCSKEIAAAVGGQAGQGYRTIQEEASWDTSS